MRIRLAFSLALFVFSFSCFGQQARPFPEYLKNEVKGSKGIAFRNAGADLLALREAIGDKKVVFLGESYHDDGTTIKAKARIVRYLHEEMGFNVIVYESSFCETYRLMQQARNKLDFLAFINNANFLYTSEDQFTLWNYVYAKAKLPKPRLEFVGIDVSIGNKPYGLLHFLELELKALAPEILKDASWQQYRTTIMGWSEIKAGSELEQFKKLSVKYTQILENKTAEKDRTAMLAQMLRNLSAQFNFVAYHPPIPKKDDEVLFKKWSDFYALCDKQMGENLNWVIERSLNKGKKVIVWASSYHTSRNIQEIPFAAEETIEAKPMGQFAFDRYKDEIYSIAFVAHSGHNGMIFDNVTLGGMVEETDTVKIVNKNNEVIGKTILRTTLVDSSGVLPKPIAPVNSLENLIHGSGHKFAFFSLAKLPEGTKFNMHPTFGKYYFTEWSKIYDGIYFIDEMKPLHLKPLYIYTRHFFEDNILWFWPGEEVR